MRRLHRGAIIGLVVTLAVSLAAPVGSAEDPPQSPTTRGVAPPPAKLVPRPEPALPGAINVAVFGDQFDGISIANALNTDPGIVATVVDRDAVNAGLPGYAVLVVRLADDTPTVEMRRGLRAFVRRGGGVIGEWWGAGAALSGVAESRNDFLPPELSLVMFAGFASGGDMIETGHPVQITRAHPVTAGLPDVLQEGDATEFFVQSRKPRDFGLKTIATYERGARTYPAIRIGRVGGAKLVLIFFDAGDAPAVPTINRLLVNSVYWTAS